MTDRDKLADLILNAPKIEFPIGSRAQGKTYQTAQNIADHLLANGVIVPPVKVGQTVYIALGKEPKERKILYFAIESADCCFAMDDHDGGWLFDSFGKTVFLTREEAEKAIAERSNHEQRKAD